MYNLALLPDLFLFDQFGEEVRGIRFKSREVFLEYSCESSFKERKLTFLGDQTPTGCDCFCSLILR